jgi:hypothetical protein
MLRKSGRFGGAFAPSCVISSCLLLISCGRGDPGRADAGTDARGTLPAPAPDSDVAAVRAEPTTSGPFADLSTTLVEKAGVMPIGYFEVALAGGVIQQCMGGYVGKGRFVTAGHCFRGVETLPACPQNLRFTWLKADGSLDAGNPDRTGCLEATVREEQATGIDFALVKLTSAGTWPEDALRFGTSAGAAGKRIKFAGPQGLGANLLIRMFTGFVVEIRANDHITNAKHRPGYSGTPVFVEQTDGLTPINPSSEAIGIHLGSVGSASRQLKGEVIQELLK